MELIPIVDREVDIAVVTNDDKITLEHKETITLMLVPQIHKIYELLQEFIRSKATVNIDRKCNCMMIYISIQNEYNIIAKHNLLHRA